MSKRFLKEGYVKAIRKILESEVEQAEVLIAAKGFAQEMQSMIEKVGRLQNEDLGPVVDQMRETYGNEIADTFNQQLDTALQEILDGMKSTQSVMNNAVNDIAQGMVPSDTLGGVDMDTDLGLDAELGGDDMGSDLGLDADLDDQFAGDDAAAGPEDEPLGRMKKESREDKARRLMSQLQEAKQKLQSIKNRK